MMEQKTTAIIKGRGKEIKIYLDSVAKGLDENGEYSLDLKLSMRIAGPE